jgi:atypical dual specificity phosphatase
VNAFWWFRENSIAGMGRPGLNAVRWYDLPFDEAILLGWVGRHSTPVEGLESFREHLRTYAPRVFPFYDMDDRSGQRAIAVFADEAGISSVLAKLAQRTKILDAFEVRDDQVHFSWNRSRLDDEIRFLKDRKIARIVTLTERHHHRDVLADHFALHHIGIDDLGAPSLGQVHELAEILGESRARNQSVAVHCLAGIGRTSTMLMGAHIVLGESPVELRMLIKRQNPVFILTGEQEKFINSLTSGSGRTPT